MLNNVNRKRFFNFRTDVRVNIRVHEGVHHRGCISL